MYGSKIWTKSFIAICLSSFFMYITVYLLNTTFPTFIKEALHGNQQQMGLVITLWSVGVVAFRLFSGRWVERFGMKLIAIYSLILFLLAVSIYLSAYSFLFLLIIRMLHGGSFAVAATATSALAADLIPESRKGEGIGYFTMFMSIAMVIGPAMGAFLISVDWGNDALFIASFILSGLALISLLFVRHSQLASINHKHHIKNKKYRCVI